MLTLLKDFPANVLAVKASGEITKKDYEEVLVPAAEAKLKEHDKIRIYYEIGDDFRGMEMGAAWADCKLGFEHLSRWERAAVVTDVAWIKMTMQAFGFLFPMRVFPASEAAEATAWLLSEH